MPTKKIKLLNGQLLENTDLFRSSTSGKWVEDSFGFSYKTEESPNFNISEITELLPPPSLTSDEKDAGVLAKHASMVTVERAGTYRVRDWQSYVNSYIQTGVDFVDESAIVNTEPITEEILNSTIEFVGDEQGVRYVYNFLDKFYENELNSVEDHSVIPNMYYMIDENNKVGTDVADEIVDIDTLKAPTVKKIRQNIRKSQTQTLPLNWFVPMENNDLILDYAGSKNLFPMYNEINLVASRKNQLNSALEDTGLSLCLVRDLDDFQDLGGDNPVSSYTGAFTTENFKYSTTITNFAGDQVVDNFSAATDVINLGRWWSRDLPDWEGGHPLLETQAFVGPSTLSAEHSSEEQDTISFGMDVDLLESYMEDYARDKARTYQDILNGDYANSETVFYRIEKYAGPADIVTTTTPIQVFHVNNFGDLASESAVMNQIRLVDTQVKYGQEYTYVVIAYQSVLGCSYRYTDLVIDEEANPERATFRVDIESYVKMVGVPLFISSGKILDNPPLPPQVRFAPLKGQTDIIKFLFGTNVGANDAVPIVLNDAEQAEIDQIMVNQGRSDGLVTFKTDDTVSSFQIFRLDTPPLNYQEFDGNLIASVTTTDTFARRLLEASTATADIVQAPNQKLYYMFRSVDTHGNVSNPSEVYEIELYADGGVGYPIVRPYEFEDVDAQTPTKSARKIIQIIPRMTQAYLNEEASGLTENGVPQNAFGNTDIVLVLEDEPLFARETTGRIKTGKRFKIRLISKTTGKKVDLNVAFKTKQMR